MAGRVKNMDESIYYTIDAIQTALSTDMSISFRYFNWNVKGEKEYRRDGAFYDVSPWALHFDDERYYLIGYDNEKQEMRHFRVDKMREVDVTSKKRQGKAEYSKKDKTKYNEQFFRMYDGEIETVTLRCKNKMANVIIDQFGTEVKLIPADDEHFTVKVEVAVSSQFLSWVIALEGNAKIIAPESVKEKMQSLLSQTYTE